MNVNVQKLYELDAQVSVVSTGQTGTVRLVHPNSVLPYMVELDGGGARLFGHDDLELVHEES